MTKTFTTAAFIGTFGVAGVASAVQIERPYTKSDGVWIGIDGTVESVSPNTFVLDYGNG